MRIEGAGYGPRTGRALVPAASASARTGEEDRRAAEDGGQRGRAIVSTMRPMDPPDFRAFAASRVYVPLLAQLIATREDHPQTRARRRGEAAEAAAAYAEGLKRVHRMPAGTMVTRTYS